MSGANDRFTSSAKTTEELLQSQTTGLVNLSDYRKRRAEAIEQKDRAAHDVALSGSTSRNATPSDGTRTPAEPAKKRKKVKTGKPTLSFGDDEDDTESAVDSTAPPSRSQTSSPLPTKSRIAANASLSVIPKAQTKRSLLEDSRQREALRKEFLQIQERVKAAEVAIPFVFYDGSNIPGGIVRVKKGEFVWVFLDGSRKVGAESGTGLDGREGEANKARREWARVGVDDLMMVRGEIIIPHHYDFYYFIMNRSLGPNKRVLFPYSAESPSIPAAKEDPIDLDTYNPLSRPSQNSKPVLAVTPISELEGADIDATFTKVVDRRWYEKNKHIYPASVWQEFDPEKDYQSAIKRDAGGNTFFFS